MIDPTTPVGKIRYKVGDVYDVPWLPDSVYNEVLSENDNKINTSAKQIAMYILALLSAQCRERSGAIEVWGKDSFDNYVAFLNMFIRDPRTSLSTAGLYAGGLSKEDMQKNNENPDLNKRPNMYTLRPVPIPLPNPLDPDPFSVYPYWM